jgi:RNA polymerase primary sigma factor
MMAHATKKEVLALQEARRVVFAEGTRQLSDQDKATIERVLLDPKFDYVENEMFHKANAKRKVIDDVPSIDRPNTSWYHPVMENVAANRTAKSAKPVLLTAQQERELFLKFNYSRYRVVKLRDKIGDKAITKKQARDLIEWIENTEMYRDQIAQMNLALVLAMGKRTRMSEVDFGDLVSEGNMALLRAVDKFDVARGFKFSTYACRAILKAFSRAGVKFSKYRQLFPTDFDPKLEKSNFMENKRKGHEHDCVDEVQEIIGDNRADLTDIEHEVIQHRFGLAEKRKKEPEAGAMTLEQVGRIIGVTKERVRQIQNKALGKIRQTLEEGYLG